MPISFTFGLAIKRITTFNRITSEQNYRHRCLVKRPNKLGFLIYGHNYIYNVLDIQRVKKNNKITGYTVYVSLLVSKVIFNSYSIGRITSTSADKKSCKN